MKIASLLMLVALLAAGSVRAQAPASASPSKALTDLITNSHWAWYEGSYENYKKRSDIWIEFYKDGTARVPWRDYAQQWTLTEPNVLTVTAGGKSEEKHV